MTATEIHGPGELQWRPPDINLKARGMHIIQKSHLKIKVPDKVRAFEIQSQVIDTFHAKVMEVLEQELDKWAPEGQVIQIDRLVLDLGTLSVENLREELPKLVREKLKEVFPQVMATNAGQKERTKVVHVSSDDSDLEALMRFLETGRMGWEVDASSSSPMQMMEALRLAQPEALRRALEMRLGHPHVAKRLSLQFPAKLLGQLLDLLAMPHAGAVSALLPEVFAVLRLWVSQLNCLPNSPRRQEALVYAAMLRNLPAAHYRLPAKEIVRRILIEWSIQGQQNAAAFESNLKELDLPALSMLLGLAGDEFSEVSKQIQRQLDKEGTALNVRQIIATLVQQWLLAYATSTTWTSPNKAMLHAAIVEVTHSLPNATYKAVVMAILGSNHKVRRNQIDTGNAKKSQAALATGIKKPEMRPQVITPDAENPKLPKPRHPIEDALPGIDVAEGEIYVTNGGLALLNPFFQPCFEDLGWMKEGQFLDAEAQENAVLFTAYLACGENEISEDRLPLAKLLCGMDLDQPVRAQVDLPEDTLTEADTLLTAANGYWEKAGKLTPDQFREAFLIREAKLMPKGSGWDLKVDRHTIDILLEFLPWSFGTIKLPWMPRMLSVDW